MNILFFLRFRGYLETAPAMWAAQTLLQGATPSPASRELAHACLRHACALEPWDPELVALANQLGQTLHLPPLPMPQALRRAAVDALLEGRDPQELLALPPASLPAAARLRLLLGLWASGQHQQVFLQETLRWSTEEESTPARALLAWAAHALGETTLRDSLLHRVPPSIWRENLLGHLALAAGDDARACRHFQESLVLEPAQPHLIEALALMADRLPLPDPNQYRVHILFYTFNKLETTLRTLESLLASDIGDAAITLLNNGSTAFAPKDLDASVARLAAGRPIQVVHLPVNIGAPAARNWLWHLPEVQEAEFVAYLDDDVLLPRHWLRRFLADLLIYPQTCAVGGKVVNPNPFHTIQYIYRYFQEVAHHHIRFTPNAPLALDLGQYDVLRPCLSVMGCCHLFHRRRLERLGVPDFDVRFTPSQVDDLERDIQIWKHGGFVLYDGRVAITHLQDAGSAAPKSEASWAHVMGNHHKMEGKFTERELRDIHHAVHAAEAAWWDKALERALPLLAPSAQSFWRRQRQEQLPLHATAHQQSP